MDIKYALFMVPGFVIGLTVHEAAHAITSRWLGDNLAGRQGRITLNPLKHLSPLGTLMLFIAGFGWGNPVQVNLYNYKHPKRDYLISSLAGPVSNIIMAAISLALMYTIIRFIPAIQGLGSWIERVYRWVLPILFFSMIINVVLAVVNLIPIPPLDGSKIWPCIIPGMRPTHSSKMMWVWIIVLIIMLKTGATGKIINPVIKQVSSMASEVIQLEQSEEQRPKNFPDDLYAPAGAEVIEYDSWRDDENTKCFFIRFIWKESHPPTQLLDWIHNYTEQNDWVIVNDDESAKWLGIEDENGKQLSWNQEWSKSNENILEIELYRYFETDYDKLSGWIYGDLYYYVNYEE
jgi:Zn-dependent protease